MAKEKFEIRQIDAIAYDEGYIWDTSYHLCFFNSAAADMKRAFLRQLHKLGIDFTVKVKVNFDGDIWEVVTQAEDMPLFACLPVSY